MATRSRRCERCAGNLLFYREDRFGEWRCLQCGRTHYPEAVSLRLVVELDQGTGRCEECAGPMLTSRVTRRYCSDRCRMRAARRRWAGQRAAV